MTSSTEPRFTDKACHDAAARKRQNLEPWLAPWRGQSHAPEYLAFIAAFNDRRFFEAHELLEALWIPARGSPDASFLQGLIQLAGAFVHLQKGRFAPCAALLRLARQRLSAYPDIHRGLPIAELRANIDHSLTCVSASQFQSSPAALTSLFPRLDLRGTPGDSRGNS